MGRLLLDRRRLAVMGAVFALLIPAAALLQQPAGAAAIPLGMPIGGDSGWLSD